MAGKNSQEGRRKGEKRDIQVILGTIHFGGRGESVECVYLPPFFFFSILIFLPLLKSQKDGGEDPQAVIFSTVEPCSFWVGQVHCKQERDKKGERE